MCAATSTVCLHHPRQISQVQPHRQLTFPSAQVTVFEQEHFQGKCLEFTSECCNIQECGLDNIRSIRVESGA